MFGSTHPGVSKSGNVVWQYVDHVDDHFAFRYVSDGSEITGVQVMGGVGSGTPGNMEFLLVGTSGGDPGTTDLGSTLKEVAPGDWPGSIYTARTVNFTTAYTPTAGDVLYLLIRPKAGGTFDGSNRFFLVHGATPGVRYGQSPHVLLTSADGGTSWSDDVNAMPGVTWLGTGGAGLRSFSTCLGSSSIADNWTDAANPDERGLLIEPVSGLAWDLHGFNVAMWLRDATTSDYTFYVYTGSSASVFTEELAIPVDISADVPSAFRNVFGLTYFHWLDSPIRIADGDQLRITVKATGAGGLTVDRITFGSAAGRDGYIPLNNPGPKIQGCTRNGHAGNFTDSATTVYTNLFPLLAPVSAGGGSANIYRRGANNLLRR